MREREGQRQKGQRQKGQNSGQYVYQCEDDFIEIEMRLIDVICEYIGIKVSN